MQEKFKKSHFLSCLYQFCSTGKLIKKETYLKTIMEFIQRWFKKFRFFVQKSTKWLVDKMWAWFSKIELLKRYSWQKMFQLLLFNEKSFSKYWNKYSTYTLQLNEYETTPYFNQFSQNLTCDCLLISVFSPEFPQIYLSWT